MTASLMGITLPTVSVTRGPTWATMLNAAFDTVGAHDHSSGKGVKVTPSGLNISSDLEFNGNDATELRSTRFENQGTDLAGVADLGAIFVKDGNLKYRNTSGTVIGITSGGTLNSAALVSNLWEQQAIAGDTVISAAATYVELKVDTAAARLITLPAISGVTSGRFYVITDVSGSAATNNITIRRGGTDTIEGSASDIVISQAFGGLVISSDGTSNWQVKRFARPASTTQQGTVKLATDFGGTADAPTVLALTGSGGAVTVRCADISFAGTLSACNINQAARSTAGSGAAMSMIGQAGLTSGNGGNINITGGPAATAGTGGDVNIFAGNSAGNVDGAHVKITGGLLAGTGVAGQVRLKLGTATGESLVQVLMPATGRRAVALASVSATGVSSTELPINTGDGVVFLADCQTAPSAAPVNGVVLYSRAVSNVSWFGICADQNGGSVAPLEISTGAFATTATAGGLAKPATYVGYLPIRANGITFKIPLYQD